MSETFDCKNRCRSGAPHLREETEIKHCKKCGKESVFTYHIVRGIITGNELRNMTIESQEEVLSHLSDCQPELLVEVAKQGVHFI